MATSIIKNQSNLSSFFVAGNNTTDFESALYNLISGFPYSTVRLGIAYGNYSGSPTQGGRCACVACRTQLGDIVVFLLNAGKKYGVYSNGGWTWT